MTEDNAPLTITLKGGAGYAAPWLVIRADNVGEARQRLLEARQGQLFEDIVNTAAFFTGSTNAAPLIGNANNGNVQQSAPPANNVVPLPQQNTQQAPPPQQQQAQAVQQQQPPVVELHPNKSCSLCGNPLHKKWVNSRKGNRVPLWVCPNGQRQGDGHDSEPAWG